MRRAKLGINAELLFGEHAHFIQLHHRSNSCAEADGVNAFFVAQHVGILQGIQIIHAIGCAKRPSSFVFQAAGCAPVLRLVLYREVVFVDGLDAAAGNRAAEAGLVGHQGLFAIGRARRGHRFGRNVFCAFKLVVAVITGRQRAHFVDHVHQHLRAIGGQALACHGVVSQDFFLLFGDFHEGLRIADIAHALGAAHGNCLQILAAHDRAHAGAAGCAMQIIDHRSKENSVFPGFADTAHARERVL